MKCYRNILIVLSLVSTLLVEAQTPLDAFRFSNNQIRGTARFAAIGGAYGAIGADFTSTSINPAGIGLYRSSEVSLTPNIYNIKINSEYNGVSTQDSKTHLALGNIGFIYSSPLKSNSFDDDIRRIQFGLGMNRLQDYNSATVMAGPNAENSLLQTYVEFAEGPPQASISEIEFGDAYAYDLQPAWWTYLLDVYGDSSSYNYYQPIPYGGAYQTKIVDTRGSLNEFVLSLAGNYSDRWYFGATLGFPFLRYTESSTFSEDDVADTIWDFKYYERTEYLETKGTGINLKLGVIYRPSPWIRLGAAFHTPTLFFSMKDYWWTEMESWFDNDDNYQRTSPNGEYKYKLTSPLKAILSSAFIMGQQGLISLDYEYTNYKNARLNSADYDFEWENNTIKEVYRAVHSVRIGTEWRAAFMSFRAGFNYSTSPYNNDLNLGAKKSYSLGLGFRHAKYFIDLAWVHTLYKLDYYFYYTETTQPNPVQNAFITNNYLVTAGFRF